MKAKQTILKAKKHYTILVLITMLIIFSCNKKQSLPKIDLEAISNIKTKEVSINKTIITIALIDNSKIYFENFHKLKFDIVINENYEKVKDYESLVISCEQIGKNIIHERIYSKKDISDIKKIFSNKYSKRNLYVIVNTFNASEFWNLDYTLFKFSEYIKDNKTLTYDQLIIRHSELQNGDRKDSIATQRIELLRDYFKEEGMQKAWNERDITIDASDLVKKIEFILQK